MFKITDEPVITFRNLHPNTATNPPGSPPITSNKRDINIYIYILPSNSIHLYKMDERVTN